VVGDAVIGGTRLLTYVATHSRDHVVSKYVSTMGRPYVKEPSLPVTNKCTHIGPTDTQLYILVKM